MRANGIYYQQPNLEANGTNHLSKTQEGTEVSKRLKKVSRYKKKLDEVIRSETKEKIDKPPEALKIS
jgi:hypothetical protein